MSRLWGERINLKPDVISTELARTMLAILGSCRLAIDMYGNGRLEQAREVNLGRFFCTLKATASLGLLWKTSCQS